MFGQEFFEEPPFLLLFLNGNDGLSSWGIRIALPSGTVLILAHIDKDTGIETLTSPSLCRTLVQLGGKGEGPERPS